MSAAIWNWGCEGRLGDERVTFDNGRLLIEADKTPLGDIGKLDIGALSTRIDAERVAGKPLYILQSGNDLDDKTIAFARDEGKRKVVFTEKSSRTVFKKHRYLGGRDEDTALFRKVYRIKREDEPEREIAMQCKDYQLSTCAGRCKRD